MTRRNNATSWPLYFLVLVGQLITMALLMGAGWSPVYLALVLLAAVASVFVARFLSTKLRRPRTSWAAGVMTTLTIMNTMVALAKDRPVLILLALVPPLALLLWTARGASNPLRQS